MVTRRDIGVSPVIATILMVAITVVLAATLYIMIGDMNTQGNPNTSPPISFVPTKNGNHNWMLQVASGKISPIDMKYSILTKNYTYVVIGADFPIKSGVNDTNGITWMDANGDGAFDTGDTVLINSNSIDSGDYFKITAGGQGEAQLPY